MENCWKLFNGVGIVENFVENSNNCWKLSVYLLKTFVIVENLLKTCWKLSVLLKTLLKTLLIVENLLKTLYILGGIVENFLLIVENLLKTLDMSNATNYRGLVFDGIWGVVLLVQYTPFFLHWWGVCFIRLWQWY